MKGDIYSCLKHGKEMLPIEGHCYGCEIEKLESQVKRYRAALKAIKEVDTDSYEEDCWKMNDIAYEALKEETR